MDRISVDPVESDRYYLPGKEISHEIRLKLHKAAIEGNVKEAKSLYEQNLGLMLRSDITERLETVLHVATGAKQTGFVEEMIKLTEFEPSFLRLEDCSGNNAFSYAAMVGSIPIAKMMLKIDPKLFKIRGGADMTPLYQATWFGQRNMAAFLYGKYNGSKVEDDVLIFRESIRSNLYDLALKLLEDNEELAVVNYEQDGTALHMLARNPSAFNSTHPGLLKRVKNLVISGKNLIDHKMDTSTPALQLLECLWKNILKQRGEDIWDYMNSNKTLLFEAAKHGNSKFLKKIICFYPDVVGISDEEGRTIFHIAIMHRHVAILNLMDDIGFNKPYIACLTDKDNNNLLHLAAAKCPDSPRPVSMMPGAALQMQQELKTFKEVSLLVMPSYRETKNKEGFTPRELFTRDHKELLKNGEDWMKKTAESCTLVATIIATMVFTAAFSVPGDYDDNGIPKHLKQATFCSFTLADAVTLSSASISILLFLSILTSRYEEEDFLKSLPLKLIFGLLTLFISITTMMLSFSLSFFLAYSKAKISYVTIPILICLFVFGPVILFLYLQRRLLKDMFDSLFYTRFSCKPNDY